jgi:hypothetical protein
MTTGSRDNQDETPKGIDRRPPRDDRIDQHEPRRFRERQRLEEEGVGQAQHGAVDGETERQRRNGRRREPGVAVNRRKAWRRS